jgi:hypothetical protein
MNAEYIPNSGGVVVSKSILAGVPVKWMLREPSVDAVDTGWRFISETDDDAYLADPTNLSIVTFNDVANIEPAILAIYDLPVGSDLALIRDAATGRIHIVDSVTGMDVV